VFVNYPFSLKKSLLVLADEKKGSPVLYDLIEVNIVACCLATIDLQVFFCPECFYIHSHFSCLLWFCSNAIALVNSEQRLIY